LSSVRSAAEAVPINNAPAAIARSVRNIGLSTVGDPLMHRSAVIAVHLGGRKMHVD
jgi:hypothetical protein